MKSDNVLLTVAIVAVIVSAVGMTFTYNSVSSFQNLMTGYLVENGTVNLTIDTQTSINITYANGSLGDNLNWGNGNVENGRVHATLITNGTNVNSTGFDVLSEGFRIENIGNVNVTNLSVHVDNASTTWLGSGSSFDYNVTNYYADSCVTWEGSANNTWTSFTTSPFRVCSLFDSANGKDVIRMDLKVVIPSSAEGDKDNYVRLTYV